MKKNKDEVEEQGEDKLNQEQLALLNEQYPVSGDDTKVSLPRFGMISKDLIEEVGTGKNKKINIIQPAGTFFIESDKGETNKDGKKIWTREYIDGETVDVNIVYHRYQLRKYDSSLKKFISSPVYDNAEQILPLYLDKQVIKRGTEKTLQGLYPAVTQKGKPTSDLKKEVILYVIYNGVLHSFNLSQSSKWEFMSYKRKVNPSTVITTLSTTEETFGTNTYRKVMFNLKRTITSEEFGTILDNQNSIKSVVESDSRFLLESSNNKGEIDAEEAFGSY